MGRAQSQLFWQVIQLTILNVVIDLQPGHRKHSTTRILLLTPRHCCADRVASQEARAAHEAPASDREATPSTEDERDAEARSRVGSHPHIESIPNRPSSQPLSGAYPPVRPYDGPPLYKPSPAKKKRPANVTNGVNGARSMRASPHRGTFNELSMCKHPYPSRASPFSFSPHVAVAYAEICMCTTHTNITDFSECNALTLKTKPASLCYNGVWEGVWGW